MKMLLQVTLEKNVALSAAAVEYTECTSVEE